MAGLNQAKLMQVVEHLQAGGETNKKALVACIGATIKTQNATVQKYLDAIDEETDEHLVGLKMGDPNPYRGEEPADDSDVEEEDEQEEEEEETPEPAPAPKKEKKGKKEKPKFKFYLETADGRAVELIENKRNGKIISFIEKPKTQLVQIMLKGKIVDVDLIPLRQKPQDEINEYGISNAKLLALCVAAQ